MSDLYINKRIDRLGRIVIPKEIRKKLRILENENLNIYYEDEKIVIKKSSDDLLDLKIFSDFRESIKRILNVDVSIFNINNNFYGKLILTEKELEEFVINRKLEFEKYNVIPLYPNGFLYGGIIIEKDMLNKYGYIFECFRTFLEKYLEE